MTRARRILGRRAPGAACAALGLAVVLVAWSAALATPIASSSVPGRSRAGAVLVGATTYTVTAYVPGTTPYGQRPTFGTRINPTPPTGAFTGAVTCSDVWVNGAPTPIDAGPGLTAGSYTVDPTSRTGLSLTPDDGTFTYLGGTYNVVPDQTVVAPENPVVTDATAAHPHVTLAARAFTKS